jgi:hypothetical protein
VILMVILMYEGDNCSTEDEFSKGKNIAQGLGL